MDVPRFNAEQDFQTWKLLFALALPRLLKGVPVDDQHQLKLSYLLQAGGDNTDFSQIVLDQIRNDPRADLEKILNVLEKFFGTKESHKKFELVKKFREIKNGGEDLRNSLKAFDSLLQQLKSLNVQVNDMEKVMSFIQALPGDVARVILNRGLPLDYSILRTEAENQLDNILLFEDSGSHTLFAAHAKVYKKCFKCGYELKNNHKCPAQNSACQRCGKIGHFKKMCTSSTQSNNSGQSKDLVELRDSNGKIFRIPSSLISKYSDSNIQHINYIAHESAYLGVENFELSVEPKSLAMFVDTGCTKSIFPEKTFSKFIVKKTPKTTEYTLADGTKRVLSKFDVVIKVPLFCDSLQRIVEIYFSGALSADAQIALLKKPRKLILDNSDKANNYIALQSTEYGELLFKLHYGSKLPYLTLPAVPMSECAFSADCNGDKETTKLWHSKLNHPGAVTLYETMRSMGMDKLTSQRLCKNVSEECTVCQMYNMKKVSIPEKNHDDDTHAPLCFNDLVFQDIKEIVEPGVNGFRYVSVMIDQATRYLSLMPLTAKSNAIQHLIKWNNSNYKNFGNIRILKTDNGGEFVNRAYKQFCTEKGIFHDTSAPYTPETQGLVERVNSTFFNKLAKLFADQFSRVPKCWWPVCLEGIARNYNLTIHSSTGLSPSSAKHNGEEQFDDLLTIGDPVVFFDNKPRPKTLEPKGRSGLFLCQTSPSCSSILVKEENRFKLVKIHPQRVKAYKGCADDIWDSPKETQKSQVAVLPPSFAANSETANDNPNTEEITPDREITPDNEQQEIPSAQENSTDAEIIPDNSKPMTVVPPGKGVIYRKEGANRLYFPGLVLKSNARGTHEIAKFGKMNDQCWEIIEFDSCNSNSIVSEFDFQEAKLPDTVSEIVSRLNKAVMRDATGQNDHTNPINEETSESETALDEETQVDPDQDLLLAVIAADKGHIDAKREEIDSGKFDAAMTKELNRWLETDAVTKLENPSFEIVKSAVPSRWICTWKKSGTDQERVAKARIVAIGFLDKSETETYSGTPDHNLLKIVTIFALSKKLRGLQADVTTAFLQAPIGDYEMFIKFPKYVPKVLDSQLADKFEANAIYKCNKAVYGFKFSPRVYTEWFKKEICAIDWITIEESIFVKMHENEVIAVLVMYVDDLWIFATDPVEELNAIKKFAKIESYELIDDGQPHKYLGMHVTKTDENTMEYDQTPYLKTIYIDEEFSKVKMTNKDFLEPAEEEIDLSLVKPYERLIGQLGWCVRTNPNAAFIYCHFSRFSRKPSQSVFRSLKKAIKYCQLHSTPLRLKGVKVPALRVFSDAAYNFTSYSGRCGYEVQLMDESELAMENYACDDNLVAWKSSTQGQKFASTTSVEMRALRDAVKVAPMYTELIRKLWNYQPKIQFLIDNEPLRQQLVSRRYRAEPRRQGELDYILQELSACPSSVKLVGTKQMRADRMTKFVDFAKVDFSD